MSSGSYWQVYVGCPFYKSDDGKTKIICEGTGNASNLSQYYREKADFETQMRVFCCGRYKNCEIFRMIMEKYDE